MSTTNNDEEKKVDELLQLCVHSTVDNLLRVSVIPPTATKDLKRPTSIICCVVDISGSMRSEAIIKNQNGQKESYGLSILDLVKHSIKTIIHCLTDTDYLSIVTYSDKANIVTELMQMNDNNKQMTLGKLDSLHPAGCTNLWDGLYNGLEVLRKNTEIDCKTSNSAVLLFTDGQPNVVPPKGHIAMLQQYIDQNVDLFCTINTYGFGYELDTRLLNDLAIKGNGTYSFIPDSSFVGTIFVNSISNFCCNVVKNVVLKIETNTKKYEATVVGDYDHQMCSWGIQINLGNVQYGQSKDIVIKFVETDENKDNKNDEGKQVDNNSLYAVNSGSLNYILLTNGKFMKSADIISIDEKDLDSHHNKTQMMYYRLLSCDILRECMNLMQLNSMDEAQKILKEHIKTLQSNKLLKKEKYIIDLLLDLTGQAFEAISKQEYYQKWGKHYLPSLIFAHLHQYNNNFKDSGVQNYGGEMFNFIRDKGNDIFIKLPPPSKVSPQQNTTFVAPQQQNNAPQPQNNAPQPQNNAPQQQNNKAKQFFGGMLKQGKVWLKRKTSKNNALSDAEDELDQQQADNEQGFGKDLDVGDVAFNPMATGVPGMNRPADAFGNELHQRQLAQQNDMVDVQAEIFQVRQDYGQVNMSAFYNVNGGCFGGSCNVLMFDNTLKLVSMIKCGDVVSNGAMVKCVIKYRCKNNKMILSTLLSYNSLKITPYHPVKMNNEWMFPNDIDNGNQKEEECEFVYNFILSDSHILMVNGVQCCTLAHNFTENDVISHSYFGTDKIVSDLKKCSGYKNGLVILDHNSCKRNPNNNLVQKIVL